MGICEGNEESRDSRNNLMTVQPSNQQRESAPAQPPALKNKEPKEFPVALAAGAAFLAIALGVMAFIATRPGPPPPPPPSQEAYDYLGKLTISDIQLSAAENMLGHEMVYVDAKVQNNGDKTVTTLWLRLYFYDYSSKLLLREEQDVIQATSPPSSPPLAPGETRDFQLRFDTLPPTWNKQPPQFQLVSLQLQ